MRDSNLFESYVSPRCIATAGNTIEGFLTDGKIKDCSLYYEVDTNKYGCYRCKNGYNGRINENGALGFIEYCTDSRLLPKFIATGM